MAEKVEGIKITSGVAVAQMFQGVQTIQDLFRMDAQARNIDTLKAELDLSIGLGMGTAGVQADAGPEGDADHLRSQIVAFYEQAYDFWKAGIYQGVGATWADAVDRLVQSANWIFAYKTLQFEVAINQRMRRHWNKVYHPMVPDASTAIHLYIKGKMKLDEFKTYASYDGWDEKNAGYLQDHWTHGPDVTQAMKMYFHKQIDFDQVKAIMKANYWEAGWEDKLFDVYTQVPQVWDAFNMWAKGLITEDQRNEVYLKAGFTDEWWDKLTQNFMYVPGPYELMRMADFVEMDQIWTLDVLKKRGISEKDRAMFWEAIQVRPLREEVRALTTEWIWRRRYGRCTEDDLKNALTELPIRTKEKELDIQKAELQYQDELVDEWIAILQWKFRTAKITEDEFMQGLLDLKIVEEKANLIVELEKAKGYYGYY
jgi:hypothetical protein